MCTRFTLPKVSIIQLWPGGQCTTMLTEKEVVRPEELSDGSSSDSVHGARLQVHQHRPRHVLGIAALVEVHVDTLNLQVRVAFVKTHVAQTMLIRDDLPELKEATLWLQNSDI